MSTIETEIAKLKPVHTITLSVRWSDMDALGHVNNSVYFTYFEQARIEWWLTAGANLSQQSEGPIVITAECIFKKPIFHPADLQINVYAGLPGTSSYMIFYEVFVKIESLELVAQGSTKIVWVDYKQGKALPLPEKMRKLIEA